MIFHLLSAILSVAYHYAVSKQLSEVWKILAKEKDRMKKIVYDRYKESSEHE